MSSTLRLLTRHLGRNTFNYGHNQIVRPATATGTAAVDNITSSYRYYSTSHRLSANWRHQFGSTTPQSFSWSSSSSSASSLISRCEFGTKSNPDCAGKSDSKASAALADSDIFGEASKLGLFAKFKLMYKKYWYVLIPVHVVTSIGWYGGFYYLSKSGVDVPALLQYVHFSETIIQKVQNSDMGHLAIAYLCYKVVTPLRYAVTLGGTTVSIKYLVQTGYIKPMPTKNEILQMYEDKKAERAAIKEAKAEAEAEIAAEKEAEREKAEKRQSAEKK